MECKKCAEVKVHVDFLRAAWKTFSSGDDPKMTESFIGYLLEELSDCVNSEEKNDGRNQNL